MHLFARVEFFAMGPSIELWKRAFPDPSNSPAHHTRNLFIEETSICFDVDTDPGDWIRAFLNVVHLEFWNMSRTSLVPFHALSPAVRSLRLTSCPAEIFDLVCSFPLLEDLVLDSLHPESYPDEWNAPLTSPKFTGTLSIRTRGWDHSVIRRLLGLPGGLHFSEINAVFFHSEAELVQNLVLACSDTLEFLTAHYFPSCAFPPAPVTNQNLTTARGCRPTWDCFS